MAIVCDFQSIFEVRQIFLFLTNWQRIVPGLIQYFVDVVLVDAAVLHSDCNISTLGYELALLKIRLFPNTFIYSRNYCLLGKPALILVDPVMRKVYSE